MRRSRILWVWVVALLMACRTAGPPTDDEVPVETDRPETEARPAEVDEEAGEPRERSEGEEVEVEEAAPEGEQIASHVDARIQAALSRAQQGDRSTAMDTLRDLVSEPEGGFLAAYNLGVLHDRAGEGEDAARRYAQALERQPDFTPALTSLVRLYLRNGQQGEAERIAQRYVDERPDNLDHRAVRLEIWMDMGRYEDVIEGGRDILRRDARHVDGILMMAAANVELRRYELAEAMLARVIDAAPQRAEIYYLLGRISLGQNDEDGARANFRQAVEMQPDFPEARNEYGRLLHKAGNYPRALEHLTAATEQAPAMIEARVNLGNTYKALGQYEEAEGAFLKALEMNGRDASAHFNLGILYLEAEVPGHETIPRLRKALSAFQEYRQIVGDRAASEGPVASYINEASSAIEREEAREEMLRRAQMQEEQQQQEADDAEEDEE